MSWFTNLFKKKNTKVNNTSNVAVTNSKKTTIVTPTIPKPKPIGDAPKRPAVSNGGTLTPATVTGNKYPEYYKNLFVILDNGHGEDTPGKRSPDGKFREYKYAREIVARIANELKELGIPYAVLVPETKDVSLSERVKRANKIHVEQHNNGKVVILLSVHCNAAGNGDWLNARGWSGWTSKGVTESDKIADCLYKAAHEILDPKKIKIREDNSDGDPDWESNFYIIYKSSMPAVLTENFFQDNKEDVKYLESEEGKQDVVNIHINGIKKYADLKFKK